MTCVFFECAHLGLFKDAYKPFKGGVVHSMTKYPVKI